MNKRNPTEKLLSYFRSHEYANLSFSMQIDSGVNGPHVVVVGGTHGNEPSGVKAAVAVHESIANREMFLKRGKITFILGNPPAFEMNKRYVDEDLNRAFTDKKNRTIEGKRASEIQRFVDTSSMILSVLDLHSVSIGNFQIAVYNIENNDNFNFVRRISTINTHLAYHPNCLPGLLIEAFSRSGVENAAAIECGNHQETNSIRVALDHIHNLLERCNLIDKQQLPNSSLAAPNGKISQYETILPIVPGKNFKFLLSNVTTGVKLAEGDIFAEDINNPHIAPSDCYLVMPSKKVKETDADAGFLCKLNTIEDGI